MNIFLWSLFDLHIFLAESPKKKSKKKIHSTNRQDLLAHVSSKKTGVKRQLKRLKGESQRQKTTVKTMKLKSAFSRYFAFIVIPAN